MYRASVPVQGCNLPYLLYKILISESCDFVVGTHLARYETPPDPLLSGYRMLLSRARARAGVWRGMGGGKGLVP